MTDRSEPTTADEWNHAMEHAIERAFHPMANADQRDGFIRGWKARGLATLRAIEAEAISIGHREGYMSRVRERGTKVRVRAHRGSRA